MENHSSDINRATQEGVQVYWGFWIRVLAYIVDSGFSILLIPIFINIYYYYKEWTTIWYKATWLIIKKSQDETTKPWWWRLLGRFLAKSLFSLLIISILWFIVSIVFWLVNILTGWLWEYLMILKWVVNWLLWILALLSFFWFFSWITIPFNKRNRGIHDLRAKTVVVRKGVTNKLLIIIWLLLFTVSTIWNIYSVYYTSKNNYDWMIREQMQQPLYEPTDTVEESQPVPEEAPVVWTGA